MKFSTALLAIVSTCMASTSTGATSHHNLRRSADTTTDTTTAHSTKQLLAVLHRKENPNRRVLEGTNYRMASILGGDADYPTKSDKVKKDAKREKFQQAKVGGAAASKHGDNGHKSPKTKELHSKAPAHQFKTKDEDHTRTEEHTQRNTNFDINIVGGTGAGANEFPYFGKLFIASEWSACSFTKMHLTLTSTPLPVKSI